MARFYLKRTGMSASITDRSTHDLIGFIDMNKKKESKALISKLCKMSTEEYIQFCLDYGARLHTEKTGFALNKEAEEWYEGAWKVTTKCTMEELGLKEKDIPEKSLTKDEVVSYKKNGSIVKDTKPLKKSGKILVKKEEHKPQYSSEEEVRRAYVNKQITLEEYKELRKQFRKPLPHKH